MLNLAENEILKRLGSNIRAERRKIGLSQEALAEAASLHRTYISEVERGERNLSLVSIVRLAAALGVTVSQLIEECE